MRLPSTPSNVTQPRLAALDCNGCLLVPEIKHDAWLPTITGGQVLAWSEAVVQRELQHRMAGACDGDLGCLFQMIGGGSVLQYVESMQ